MSHLQHPQWQTSLHLRLIQRLLVCLLQSHLHLLLLLFDRASCRSPHHLSLLPSSMRRGLKVRPRPGSPVLPGLLLRQAEGLEWALHWVQLRSEL